MKQLKRTTAAALTLGMLFTSVPYAALAEAPVAAASSITQSQAEEIARKSVTIPEDFKLQNASFHDAKNGNGPFGRGSVWMLHFIKDGRYEGGQISVVVDAAKGTLVNFDFYEKDDTTVENAISREEARKKALEYLKKYAPDKADLVKEADSPDQSYMYGPYGTKSVMQVFRFERIENGIPYPSDGISIRINGKGEIRGYSFNWTDNLQFPKMQTSIPEAKAKEVFKNALNLQLQYQIVRKPYEREPKDAQLLYGPWNSYGPHGPFPMIDAIKGEAIGMDGNPVPTTPAMELKPLADKPGAPITTKEITKEVALELIASYNLGLDGYTLENVTYDSYQDRQHLWRFQYRKGDPQNFKTMNMAFVSIDAKTGELRELNRHEYREGPGEFPQNPAVSSEQAKQKAIEFIKKVMPAQIDKLALNSAADEKMNFKMGPYYSFEFVRLVNGIPNNEGRMRIGIDPNTGEVKEYWGAWGWDEKLNYQPKTNVISAETAKNKFAEKYGLRLQYIPIYENGKTPYEPGKPKGVALVYAPVINGPMQWINAVSGEWVNVWGEAPVEPAEIKDIKGHWAEKQLQYFAERGIFKVEDGKLNPEAGVTRGDMIRYLLLSIDGPRRIVDKATFADVPKTDPNFDFIEEAAARKWIDKDTKNFRPGDILTREGLADLVTTVLGYSKLADARDTLKNHFGDVDSNGKYMGDIAITYALGIMTGWDSKFNPKYNVTKAQAAVVLAKVIEQMKEKQNYPYYISK
ncbi:S-layer homology domain-containing protein [Effusibacillus consociatus]|uniref:S-layer homology domain-containing protein n=1 Tax=Effusibacillus consociatus TaxID=1117041 RepID=A0ABV9PZU5_9BACL